jgi:TatD DNase family protein
MIDGHAHLADLPDAEAALARAARAGVDAAVAVSMDLGSCERTLALAGDRGGCRVYPALGIHPTALPSLEPGSALAWIGERIGAAVAVGEIGLDFRVKEARKPGPGRDRQVAAYRALLELAGRSDLPAIVHGRGAWEECLRVAVETGVRRAVFHWYSGPEAVLDELLARGYLISATPAAAFSEQHRAAIARAPLERILLETDCPVRYDGVPSEPADLVRTRDAVAGIKGLGSGEAAATATANARAFFRLGEAAQPGYDGK